MKFVCPFPDPWSKIYQSLKYAWEIGGEKGLPPPVPLILNGWHTNDIEKYKRWKETVEWAKGNGLENLIPELQDDEKYMVWHMTSYEVGPMGGPMYLPWDYEPKNVPLDSDVKDALEKLKQNWDRIAGNNLASATCPVRLTGRKKIRLIVVANPTVKPPWGDWNCLYPGEFRRTFTRFRKAVNDTFHRLL